MIALSNSIHMYARPDVKEQFLEFFTSILGLEAFESSVAAGSSEPIYAFKFSNGAGLSVEFTEDALSDQQAQRGAWLELRTDDAVELQQEGAGCRTQESASPVYSVLLYPGARRAGIQNCLQQRNVRHSIDWLCGTMRREMRQSHSISSIPPLFSSFYHFPASLTWKHLENR